MIASLITGLTGYIASRFLFSAFPCLDECPPRLDTNDVSVIIPARNEALTLPYLLDDLKQQKAQPLEVICVDDDSTDDTGKIASSYGVCVIKAPPKPDGWLGKPWACEVGSQAARGKHLLFLDADVRLAPDALASLMKEYGNGDRVVSVQPFHTVPKAYEQMALIFNILQFGANGASLPQQQGVGLFGPVILMSRSVFNKIEGYSSVRSSIIEDVALGEQLKKADVGFRLYAGGKMISFRMYRDGIGSLIQGWTKNFASGAVKTPFWLMALVFLWVTGCSSVPFYAVLSIVHGDWLMTVLQVFLYVLWTKELWRIGKRLGSFSLSAIVLYPIPLCLFLWVFTQSGIKRISKSPVQWKGRIIRWEK